MTINDKPADTLHFPHLPLNQSGSLSSHFLIGHDLQIEAEALGCRIKWDDNNQPKITSHSFRNCLSPDKYRIPGPADGRIDQMISKIMEAKQTHPGSEPYTFITGPFSLALQLMGYKLFNLIQNNPDDVGNFLSYTSAVCEAIATLYIEAGCTGLHIVDPWEDQLSPVQFEKFVTPFIQPLVDYIQDQGCFCSVVLSDEVNSKHTSGENRNNMEKRNEGKSCLKFKIPGSQ